MSLHDAVKVALLLDSETVVLQHRDKDAPTNPEKLTLFGGSVETGEGGLRAAVRELQEETSAVFDREGLELIATYTRIGGGTMTVFAVAIATDEFEVYEGAGKCTMKLLDALASPVVTDGTKEAIRYIIEKRKEMNDVPTNRS